MSPQLAAVAIRRVAAERDAVRHERDQFAAALRQIAEMRLQDHAGPCSMALEAVAVATKALNAGR